MVYRTGRPATVPVIPEIAESLRKLPFKRVVLDGEIIAFDEAGKPSFELLSRRIHVLRPADVRYAMQAVPVVYSGVRRALRSETAT